MVMLIAQIQENETKAPIIINHSNITNAESMCAYAYLMS